ncbi:MAG: ATP-binding protein [Armatimonadota bacterium]|nr:ATP-binding protein [Armatimonadota bacterium]
MSPAGDVVELKVPCKPEFVGVVRLMVSGVAGRMEFSYDEVEDIKLAVGEACAAAIQAAPAAPAPSPLVVRCEAAPDTLRLQVQTPASRAGIAAAGGEVAISQLLMEMLMDEVEVQEDQHGRVSVHMLKRVSRVKT